MCARARVSPAPGFDFHSGCALMWGFLSPLTGCSLRLYFKNRSFHPWRSLHCNSFPTPAKVFSPSNSIDATSCGASNHNLVSLRVPQDVDRQHRSQGDLRLPGKPHCGGGPQHGERWPQTSVLIGGSSQMWWRRKNVCSDLSGPEFIELHWKAASWIVKTLFDVKLYSWDVKGMKFPLSAPLPKTL